MHRSPVVLVLLAAALVAAGCTRSAHPPAPGPVDVQWRPATLPLPAGASGRVMVRDAATCAGTWYVAGGVVDTEGSRRPAAWASTDARTWRVLPIDPSGYYARRSTLTAIACRGGRVAALGSRSGGAHGNPRISSWHQRADGTLVDVTAPFTLFGGAEALGVGRVAAGPAGWLLGGNRTTGGAVWVSTDAAGFRLVDHDPALASDTAGATTVLDQVADGAGWTAVGRIAPPGRTQPAPLAWASPDGVRWTRQQVPAQTDGFADLERVVGHGDELVAAGLRDRGFGVWRRTRGHWRAGPSFGRLAADLGEPPFVSGLTAYAGQVAATVSDGARFGLWATTGGGRWRRVATPVDPASSGDTQMTVTGDDRTVLLLVDDGTSGRAWTAPWSAVSR